jgi:Tfp pilus assembly protein PilF
VAWGDTVQGPTRDRFALQTRLATMLADAIADQTPAAERTAFEKAIDADPKFATAHAGLAEAQWAMYQQTNDKTWADRAMASTRRAIELEPDRPSVRYIAALTAFRLGDNNGAKTQLQRALELQPTYEDAIRLNGSVLMRQGDVDAGRLGSAR